MSHRTKTVLKVALPLLTLLIAAGVAAWLIRTKPKPKRQQTGELATPVRLYTLAPSRETLMVEAAGTVIPAQQVQVLPQVAGQVVDMDERMAPGGRFAANEPMVRIDPRDYEFALAQRQSQLANARFELAQEKGRQAVAEEEWQLLGDGLSTSEEGRALALRQPQIERAKASLEAARNAVAEAELNLERTRLRAPFNATVQTESVDIGQTVGPNSPIATLTGTDTYWVQASVAVEHLSALSRDPESGYAGTPAWVTHQTGQGDIRRQGTVLRLLADLDQAGRMARLLIAIDDPLDLRNNGTKPPLLLGAFVQVELEGRNLENVFKVPAEALREGDQLWFMTDEQRLRIEKVAVIKRGADEVLLTGPQAGEQLVVSRIGAPVAGMLLQPLKDASSANDTAQAEGSP